MAPTKNQISMEVIRLLTLASRLSVEALARITPVTVFCASSPTVMGTVISRKRSPT